MERKHLLARMLGRPRAAWYGDASNVADRQVVLAALSSIVAPMVEADGGDLYLVSVQGDDVRIHLAGACSGCPGATLTSRGVIEPAVRATSPGARVAVSSGVLIPPGAELVTPPRRA